MWTYLVILISISVILLVFIRRVVFHYRGSTEKKDDNTPPVSASLNDNDRDGENISVSRKDKDRAEALCKKGLNLLKVGKDDEAIKCFVQALALNELHDETQHRLAVLYLKKQMYGAAAALFKRLVESAENPVYYSHLGLALYKQSDFNEAKNAYQRAVELDPERAPRFISLAQVYRALGQLEHSIVALNKALAIDESNIDFLLLLATVQAELKNYKESMEVLEKLLILDPKNTEALSMMKELEGLIS